MPAHTGLTRVVGNHWFMIAWGALYVVVLCFISSFLLMGTAFSRFFLALLVLAFPCLLAVFAVIRALNWFAFDDEKKQIAGAWGRSVPYEAVKAILIKGRWGRSSVAVRTGRLRKRWLADGLNKEETERAEHEFVKRLPGVVVKKKSHASVKLTALAVLFLAMVTGVYAVFLYSLYRQEPRLFLEPEKKDWMNVVRQRAAGRHTMNGIAFTLPRRFKLTQQSGAWGYFEDRKRGTKLSVGPGMFSEVFGRHKGLVRLVTGIEDGYDLYRFAYVAKFGALPTAMKVISFSGLSHAKLYEVGRTSSLRGFVLQGLREGEAFAEIVVADKNHGGELQILLRQPGILREDALKSIVGGIQPDL